MLLPPFSTGPFYYECLSLLVGPSVRYLCTRFIVLFKHSLNTSILQVHVISIIRRLLSRRPKLLFIYIRVLDYVYWINHQIKSFIIYAQSRRYIIEPFGVILSGDKIYKCGRAEWLWQCSRPNCEQPLFPYIDDVQGKYQHESVETIANNQWMNEIYWWMKWKYGWMDGWMMVKVCHPILILALFSSSTNTR